MGKTALIAKNSVFIYIKLFVSVISAFYTTRVFLKYLGADDFGIMGLVAGIVTMLTFINSAMTVTSQRFLSVGIGNYSVENQKKIFASSFLIHALIAIGFIVTLLLLQDVILYKLLNLPDGKHSIAKVLFILSLCNTLFMILQVPFDGVLASRENMLTSSLIGILVSLGKVSVAFFITKYTGHIPAVIVIQLLICSITFISFLMIVTYSFKNYEEVHFWISRYSDRKICKSMFDFAKWNLFGILSGIARTQGLNVILNMFFQVSVNAAYSISNQVNTQVLYFSQSMLGAVTPRIMQQEGAGQRENMLKISRFSSKIAFFILSMITVPLFIHMPFLLELWLGSVPEYTLVFIRLFLAVSLTGQLTVGLQIAIQAQGNIKKYQLIIGGLNLLVIPLSYWVLGGGAKPSYVLVTMLLLEIVAVFVRIILLKSILHVSFSNYFFHVILRCIVFLCLSISVFIALPTYSSELLDFLLSLIVVASVMPVFFFYFGLTKSEKAWVTSKINNIVTKKKR